MKKFLFISVFLLGRMWGQNVRFDAQFPSITTIGSVPYLVANTGTNSPVLAVCSSPANGVPCTNYAQTFTGFGTACSPGAQDTPQPATVSGCQRTGDSQGNIGFWAAAGTYDYTVCVSTICYGPFTVTLGGSSGSSGSGAFVTASATQGFQALPPSLPYVIWAADPSGTCSYPLSILQAGQWMTCNTGTGPMSWSNGTGLQQMFLVRPSVNTPVNGATPQYVPQNGDFEVLPPVVTSLGTLSAATQASTLANGNSPITWNWAQTTGSQTGLTLGETTAAVGSSDGVLGLVTLSGSTATPLTITQTAITGSTPIAALAINTTNNNGSLVGSILNVNLTDTASNSASAFFTFNGGASASTLEAQMLKNGTLFLATGIAGTSGNSSLSFCGGNSSSCLVSSNAQVGNGIFQGANNSSNGSSAKAGLALLQGGLLTNATPNAAALEGPAQVGSGYLKGAAIAAVGDVLCGTTTAYTLTDCSHTGPATNIAGIATSTTNPIGVVGNGEVPVATDNSATIGDIICMGTTTDGKGHDNGTTACLVGQKIGIVIAVAGTVQSMNGSTQSGVALSTTLPLVHLTID